MSHPATKLPWDLNKEGNIVGDNLIVAKMDRGHFLDREGDAAYIIHAANAYPKLVELIKDLTGKIEVMGGCNAHDFEGDEAWPEFERVTVLLRELGED